MLLFLIFPILTFFYQAHTAQPTAAEEAVTTECAICMDALSDAPYITPCGHLFDRACLQPWQKSKKTCPTCKAIINGTIADTQAPRERDLLLFQAIDDGNLFGVQRLLKHGANPHKAVGYALALHKACANIQPQAHNIVAELLQHNADINQKDYHGDTPLHIACRYNFQNESLLALLLNNGADINATNKNGQTPLHYAARHLCAVKLLLAHGANVDACSNIPQRNGKNRQRTALLELCTQPGYSLAEQQEVSLIASALIDHNANINALDEHGRSALHIASTRRNKKDGATITHLLRNGRAKPSPAITPHYAARASN
jgi:ankyrin repeat protein